LSGKKLRNASSRDHLTNHGESPTFQTNTPQPIPLLPTSGSKVPISTGGPKFFCSVEHGSMEQLAEPLTLI
jgi:hypothetical protein